MLVLWYVLLPHLPNTSKCSTVEKLDGLAPLMTDPPPTSSTTLYTLVKNGVSSHKTNYIDISKSWRPSILLYKVKRTCNFTFCGVVALWRVCVCSLRSKLVLLCLHSSPRLPCCPQCWTLLHCFDFLWWDCTTPKCCYETILRILQP